MVLPPSRWFARFARRTFLWLEQRAESMPDFEAAVSATYTTPSFVRRPVLACRCQKTSATTGSRWRSHRKPRREASTPPPRDGQLSERRPLRKGHGGAVAVGRNRKHACRCVRCERVRGPAGGRRGNVGHERTGHLVLPVGHLRGQLSERGRDRTHVGAVDRTGRGERA